MVLISSCSSTPKEFSFDQDNTGLMQEVRVRNQYLHAFNEGHVYNDEDFEPIHYTTSTAISVVGDIMFHNTQLFRAYNEESKQFSFMNIFTYMKPYLKASNYTFGNLETTLNGPFGSVTSVSNSNFHGFSGYPRFNTPDSLVDALVDAGFDFLSTANNHCLDRGYKGMVRTIEVLDEKGMQHTGTFLNEEERNPYETVFVNGLKFAVVNYTYATNGLTIAKEYMPLVNTLDLYKEDQLEKMYQDIETADDSGADYVILMIHYGNEYRQTEDNRYQKPITYEAIRHGADIVFGGHPHVLQPIDVLYQLDDQVFDEPKVIIYSLGNFISSQRNIERTGGNTDLGVMLTLYFEQTDNLKPEITGIGLLPTYTLWQTDVIETIPVTEDTTWLFNQGLDLNHLSYADWDRKRIEFARNYVIDHLMQYVSEKELFDPVYIEKGVYRFDFKEKPNM